MNAARIAAVICFVLLSEYARALSEDKHGPIEQLPVDPVYKEPVTFRPGSVAAGGYCRSSVQCRPGWCCLRHFKNGSYTCQKKLWVGRKCSRNSEIKGGVYHKHCPCASHSLHICDTSVTWREVNKQPSVKPSVKPSGGRC